MPPEAWTKVQAISVQLAPALPEMTIKDVDLDGGGKLITLYFAEAENADQEEYPIEATLQVVAKFDGYAELRLVEKDIVVSPLRRRQPRKAPQLLDEPSTVTIVTRQPVKLELGGATTHVRVRWDGKDELVNGSRPKWHIRARCRTLNTFPVINHTSPHDGRFELLIDTPRSLLAAQDLEFDVEAVGPKGKVLSATLRARLEPPAHDEPEGPGIRKRKVAEILEAPVRPYQFKLIGEEDWDTGTPYWNKPQWDAKSVGCFVAPTRRDPLVLVVNKDHEGLKDAREQMIKRGLHESTIEERQTKYYIHIGVHLYAMYRYRRQLERAPAAEGDQVPTHAMDDMMEAEIERAAGTVLHLLP